MSKILLISPNKVKNPYPVFPLALSILSSNLKKKGHTVEFFDFLFHKQEKLNSFVQNFEPDFIGVSIRNIDTTDSLDKNSWVLSFVKDMIENIKNKFPKIPIILGGAGFSIMPNEILTYTNADYGIQGAGEKVLLKLIDKLEKKEKTKKIFYNKEKESVFYLSEPFIKKDILEYYIKKSNIINISTKRGCPFRCSYCTYPNIEGNKFLYRDTEEVLTEIDYLVTSHKVKSFFFTDSVFNDPNKKYLELAEGLIKRKLKIKWAALFRPKGVSYNEMKILKRSGLYAIEAGSDALSDETLEGLHKKLIFSDIYNFNQICVKNSIPIAHFVIFGVPNENEKTIKKALDNVKKLEKSVCFAYSGIRIFPDTPIEKIAIKEGILKEKTSLLKPSYYFSIKISQEKMNQNLIQFAKKNRFFFFPPSKTFEHLEILQRFGYTGLLWDQLLKKTFNKK